MREYRIWFSKVENGFVKEHFINNMKFMVQYRPSDLMILNELTIDQSSVDSLRKTYGNSKYFLLEIGPDEREINKTGDLLKNVSYDYNTYAEQVKHLAYKMNESVYLIMGRDTIQPVLYHYEQGFELNPRQKFIFAFEPGNSDYENMTFVYYDELFDSGILNFKFDVTNGAIPPLPI